MVPYGWSASRRAPRRGSGTSARVVSALVIAVALVASPVTLSGADRAFGASNAAVSPASGSPTSLMGAIVGGYDVPTIADTAYAIPAGSLFVATTGSDTNPGTQQSPFATVSKAISVVPTGGTIVVRGGTYRETLGVVTNRFTLQPYPHEQVWVKGSRIVTGFTHNAAVWIKSSWAPAICRNCFPSALLDSSNPAAGLPDQVFFDGIPQRQVTTLAAAKSGRFFVDASAHQLVLGSDPTGHTVEATVNERAIQFNSSSSGSIVRGIGFAHYAPHYNFDIPAAVTANTSDITLDRDTFAWSASRGISILDPGSVVTNNLFLYSGLNGMHANTADFINISGNRVAYSNEQQWSITPGMQAQIAGIKLTMTHDASIVGNLFDDNNSNGIWFDVASYNDVIANNTLVRNLGYGIEYEASAHATVAGNLLVDNGRDGIKVSGSTYTAIWNNTIVNSGGPAVGIYDDPQSNTDPARLALDITLDTSNVSMANNVFVGGPSATSALMVSFDASSPRHLTSAQMISSEDRNLWGRTSTALQADFATWDVSLSASTTWPDLAAMRSATNRESTSVTADDVALPTLFNDPVHDDYSLVPAGPGLTTGLPLPDAVAAAMGVSSASPHLGAYATPAVTGMGQPIVSIGAAAVVEGNSGNARTMQFSVSLSRPATTNVVVDYHIEPWATSAATSPNDFTAKSAKVVFKPAASTGLTPTTVWISSSIRADTIVEADDVFAVTIIDASVGYAVGHPIAFGKIIDDDPASGLRVGVGDAAVWEGDQANTNGVKVWVNLSSPATNSVTVKVALSAGTATAGADYKTFAVKTLTFAAGQWQKSVVISTYADSTPEADETVNVTLTNPSAGLSLARSTGTVTILNDDAP